MKCYVWLQTFAERVVCTTLVKSFKCCVRYGIWQWTTIANVVRLLNSELQLEVCIGEVVCKHICTSA
jgi:hypothetical protein